MVLSRRALMVSGAALAAVSAVGVRAVDLPAPAAGARLLSLAELDLVRAVGEALFPPDSPLGIGAAEVDLGAAVDELVGEYMDPVVAPVLRYLLRALEVGTAASRGTPFGSLSLADRRAVMDTWADNEVLPRRLAYDTFKTILGMAFFNAAAVRDAVGWTASICDGGST
ncbi:MAG: gluconate 2-dehydrogenase subunit 3 family protein [Myxococcota bacterium]